MKNRLAQRLDLYLDLIRWNRPAGWLLLLWPSLSGLWVAAGGFPGWKLGVIFVLGTILMRSAGCCINDVADRDFDRHVKRTAQRPVTRGAIGSREALAVGAVLALCAFGLVLLTNWVTVAWSFVALLVAMVYPFAKRFVSMPQAVLGIAFSFGIPMAFAAVNGGPLGQIATTSPWEVLSWQSFWDAVPATAWWLLLGNLFWVLAYDTEYAMVDRDDDIKIGMKTSAITMGQWDVPIVMGCYIVWLSLWGVLLAPRIQMAVGLATLAFALMQIVWHYQLIKGREREPCFRAFRMNHWLGFTVFVGVVIGQWLPSLS